jgi:hypothetical protein
VPSGAGKAVTAVGWGFRLCCLLHASPWRLCHTTAVKRKEVGLLALLTELSSKHTLHLAQPDTLLPPSRNDAAPTAWSLLMMNSE